jgi:hypothetical protein
VRRTVAQPAPTKGPVSSSARAARRAGVATRKAATTADGSPNLANAWCAASSGASPAPRAGRPLVLRALGLVVATALVSTAMRPREDYHLALIGLVAFAGSTIGTCTGAAPSRRRLHVTGSRACRSGSYPASSARRSSRGRSAGGSVDMPAPTIGAVRRRPGLRVRRAGAGRGVRSRRGWGGRR